MSIVVPELEDARIDRAAILELIDERFAAELKRVVRIVRKPAAHLMLLYDPPATDEARRHHCRLLTVLRQNPYAE